MNIVLRRTLAVCIVPLLVSLGFANPASAKAAPKFDVQKLSVPDVVVKGNAPCKYTYVTLKKRTNVRSWDFHTRLTKGRTVLRIAYEWPFSYPYADFDSKYHPKKAKIVLCPDSSLLGRITIGPGHAFLQSGKKSVERRSKVKGYFYQRAQSKATLRAKRTGTTVRLSARATRHNADPRRPKYIAYNPRGAKLQVRSGKSWKTVKRADFKRGAANFTVASKGHPVYRISYGKVDWATGASAQVRS